MLYIYYLVILPIIYSICNIFYFIYKFKFFSWKRFNIWYINNWEFERHYLNQNKKTLGNAGTNPLYTLLIVYDEDKLKEAFAKAVEHQSYSETPQLTIKYLKKQYQIFRFLQS